jgi:hypothetical protein
MQKWGIMVIILPFSLSNESADICRGGVSGNDLTGLSGTITLNDGIIVTV